MRDRGWKAGGIKDRKKGKLQLKFLMGLMAMTAVLMVALGCVITRQYRQSMETYYKKLAFDEAKIAAEYIDGDTIKSYAVTLTEDSYYDQVSRYLLYMKETIGIKYFYVVIPYEDHMYYIWDVGKEGEEGVCSLGDVDDYYQGGREIMRGAYLNPDGEDTILITNNEEYGYLASAYVAILDSSGQSAALSCVDISMDMIDRQIEGFVAAVVLVILLVLIVFIVGYFFFIRHSVLRPLSRLSQAARTIVSEQMDDLSSFRVDVKTGDEIEELGDAFNRMAHELHSYIENLSAVTAEKERIGAELDVATHIQASMLPGIFPAFPNRPEFHIYATMEPAKEVGGDFYDFFLVDEGHLAVVIADVSGKGVPAALFMVIAKTLIKDHTQAGTTPAEVFSEVNAQLCESNEEGLFVTAWRGVLEIATGHMVFVNAGHNPPLVRQAGGRFEYMKLRPGFVLAGMEGIRYRSGEMDLAPGSTLYLYTDGVTEAANGENELYGEERLLSVLGAHEDAAPEELLPAVKADIDAFAGDAPQFDDITMLALKLSGKGNPWKKEGEL